MDYDTFVENVIETGVVFKASIGDEKNTQIIVEFENGYGCSVIRKPISYGSENGLWELAVVIVDSFGKEVDICYDTPITNDVLGYLTEEDVLNTISDIKKLKPIS